MTRRAKQEATYGVPSRGWTHTSSASQISAHSATSAPCIPDRVDICGIACRTHTLSHRKGAELVLLSAASGGGGPSWATLARSQTAERRSK
jgi:hypothetical protein